MRGILAEISFFRVVWYVIVGLIVGVLATNEGAIRFYEHLGLSLFAREYMIRVPAARERTDD
jgi:ABC-type nitrate/sulfonate/bicarbonate transport system permease component